MGRSPPSDAAAGSPAATDVDDVARRLRLGLAILQERAAELGPEVTELVVGPWRQRLRALEASAGGEGSEPWLRPVSVLFVDIVDSTGLLRELDIEDGHDVLDSALRRFGAAVHAHAGRVLRYTGDGLKAVFGFPDPADDDPVRAVRAGLDILRQAELHAEEVRRRHGLTRFALRAGIHTGPVGLGADAEHGQTLVGATVHVAARLEQQAPAGSLCVSHDTWVRLGGRFEGQALEPLAVRGLETAVHRHRVLREREPGSAVLR